MEILEFNNENFRQKILNAFTEKKQILLFGINQTDLVLYCSNLLTNLDYCIKNNIEVFNVPNVGSNIVATKGDIEIAYFNTVDDTFYLKFANKIVDFLKAKSIDASFVDNDILIDEKYKVCAFAKTLVNDVFYTAIHISININQNLINNICLKPKTKIPCGLSSFGIKSEDIKNLIIG